MLQTMEFSASETLSAEGVAREDQETLYEIDIRYIGQGMKLTITVTPNEFDSDGLAGITQRFDKEHDQLFTFALDAEHELVGLRAVQGEEKDFITQERSSGGSDCSAAQLQSTRIYSDGQWCDGYIYDRSKLQANNRIPGPAVVTEMDSTSVILPGHVGIIDAVGNIIIWPVDHANAR
jgi:N-methylhydantoinase A